MTSKLPFPVLILQKCLKVPRGIFKKDCHNSGKGFLISHCYLTTDVTNAHVNVFLGKRDFILVP